MEWGGGGYVIGDAKISNIYGVLEIPDVHPQKYQEFQAPKKKIFEILATPKHTTHSWKGRCCARANV